MSRTDTTRSKPKREIEQHCLVIIFPFRKHSTNKNFALFKSMKIHRCCIKINQRRNCSAAHTPKELTKTQLQLKYHTLNISLPSFVGKLVTGTPQETHRETIISPVSWVASRQPGNAEQPPSPKLSTGFEGLKYSLCEQHSMDSSNQLRNLQFSPRVQERKGRKNTLISVACIMEVKQGAA